MKDKVDIGVIGAGWWATLSHIPALRANPHVGRVAVMRPDANGLAQVVERFPGVVPYQDAAAMLAAEALDGVVVASPHVFHAEHGQMALSKGLPTLIEKPMATTAADARALVAAAERHGAAIVLPYGWNFKPIVETAHRLVAEGWIGEVRQSPRKWLRRWPICSAASRWPRPGTTCSGRRYPLGPIRRGPAAMAGAS